MGSQGTAHRLALTSQTCVHLFLIARRAHYQLYNLSNFLIPGSGKTAFAIEANLLTCCFCHTTKRSHFHSQVSMMWKDSYMCLCSWQNNTSDLTTWNKTISQEEGKSMHITIKLSADDSCIVAHEWQDGLLCGSRSTLNWITVWSIFLKYCPF